MLPEQDCRAKTGQNDAAGAGLQGKKPAETVLQGNAA
jgi:hypothetical protein